MKKFMYKGFEVKWKKTHGGDLYVGFLVTSPSVFIFGDTFEAIVRDAEFIIDWRIKYKKSWIEKIYQKLRCTVNRLSLWFSLITT